jgi:aryl-alcohol dehydrogenase-like predicted oxidoreductase
MLEKLILGTVQLGIPYGINNSIGKPSSYVAHEILNLAYESGIYFLDTAQAYGDSQKVIGNYLDSQPKRKFKVFSKIKLDNEKSVKDQIIQIKVEIKDHDLISLSCHQFSDIFLSQSQILKDYKVQKVINHIGVSVYSNDEFSQAIESDLVDLIQIPFNIFDNWSIRGELIQKAKEYGKEVHVRSVFLQGLFFRDINILPLMLKPLTDSLRHLHHLAQEYELSIGEMALGYALSFNQIDKVLIGVESPEQLKQIINHANRPLDTKLIQKLSAMQVPHLELIDPRNWK